MVATNILFYLFFFFSQKWCKENQSKNDDEGFRSINTETKKLRDSMEAVGGEL